MVGVRHHDHAVTGRGGDGLAAGGHTARHTAPGPVLTADVVVAVRLQSVYEREKQGIVVFLTS